MMRSLPYQGRSVLRPDGLRILQIQIVGRFLAPRKRANGFEVRTTLYSGDASESVSNFRLLRVPFSYFLGHPG